MREQLLDDEDLIKKLNEEIEQEQEEIKQLKKWSTRDKFEDKPPPPVDRLSYTRGQSVKQYADYYYSTQYYSRQANSPVGREYDTYYIRPSKQYGNEEYAHKFGID